MRCPRCKVLCTEGDLRGRSSIYDKTIPFTVLNEYGEAERKWGRWELTGKVCGACKSELGGGRRGYTIA